MGRDELEVIKELLRAQAFASMTLAEQRAAVEYEIAPLPDGTGVDRFDANGVACEWVTTPDVAGGTVVLALRGGGYCLGSLESNRRFSALLSRATSTRVVNVGYRNAPEHRFPAAVDDVLAAYRWLVSSGTPASQIAVAGNSAGGGLALAALLALRDAGDDLPACAAVVSPWTDLAATGASIVTNAATEVMLDPHGLAGTAARYADEGQLTDPYVSPLYGDPHGLPPILLQVSSAEILLDDAIRFADKARGRAVDVTVEVVDDMPHVWHLFAGLLSEADDAMAGLGAWILRQLNAASSAPPQ